MTVQPFHFSRLKEDLPHLADELDRFVEQLNRELARIEAAGDGALKIAEKTFVSTPTGTVLTGNVAKFGTFHPCVVASGANVDVWLPAPSEKNLGQRTALARMTSGGVFKIRPSAGQYINGVATGISPSLARVYELRWGGNGSDKGWRVDY